MRCDTNANTQAQFEYAEALMVGWRGSVVAFAYLLLLVRVPVMRAYVQMHMLSVISLVQVNCPAAPTAGAAAAPAVGRACNAVC